jgi:membrane-associated phospholipid phosphatase
MMNHMNMKKRNHDPLMISLSIFLFLILCIALLLVALNQGAFDTSSGQVLLSFLFYDPLLIFFRLQDYGLFLLALSYHLIKRNWSQAKKLFLSFVVMECLVHTLKVVVRRERPNGLNLYSFPSGHSANAFMAASHIHFSLGVLKALIPYVIAALVAFVRVAKQMHHFSDVCAGALIGILVSYLMSLEKTTRAQ